MKYPLLSIAFLFLGFGAPGSAQAGEALQATPEASVPDFEAELQALVDRFNAKREEAYEAYQAAETDEQRNGALATLPGEDWAPEFEALAGKAKGTDTAVRAWIWVLRLTEDQDRSWNVIERLLSESMQSPALAELPGELRYASYTFGEPRVLEALHAIVDESPHEEVRAGALFTLAAVQLESRDPEVRSGSRKSFETLVGDYGTLPYRGKSTYAAAAEGYLFELDHLQLGMAAPDFETLDENGVTWKLSDYRGKVVVVDFWGFW
jgi:hypothetical protein